MLKKLKEGQSIAFVYNGTLMTGVLWELGILDCVVKSSSFVGMVSIGRGQIIDKVEDEDVISFLTNKKTKDDEEYRKQVQKDIQKLLENSYA